MNLRPLRTAGAIASLAVAAMAAPFQMSHAAPPAVNATPQAPPPPLPPGSFAEVADRVGPAVVSIDVECRARPRSAGLRGDPRGLPFKGPFGDLRRLFPQLPF